MSAWFDENKGLKEMYRPSVAECRGILERLGDYHAAHADLAEAALREGDLDTAERHIRRALELGYPVPGLAYNTLACIAARRHDLKGVEDNLRLALRRDPQHWLVAKNAETFRSFLVRGGPNLGLPLELVAGHTFQLFERTQQPTLPGPLPEDFASWTDPATGGVRPSPKVRDFAWKPDSRVRLPMLA
jgi:hypothetical protein